MAKSPVPSLVIKTKKPTAAQMAAQARAQQPQLPDPRIMDSRRTVNAGGATVGVRGSSPIPVNRNGMVTNPSDSVGALTAGGRPAPSPGKAKVKVQIHPDGTISVTSHGHAGTPTPAPLASVKPTGGSYVTDSAGRTDTTPGLMKRTPQPGPTVKQRVAAANGNTTATAGAPSDFTQAQTQASKLLDPVIKQITDAINARTTQQQGAITGYAGELGRLFGLYSGEAGKGYDSAIASDSAVNDALANRLAGVTSSTGNDLTAKLASISADPATAARISADVAATGKGAGNAGFALGSADLTGLIGHKANAQDYGAKLPGLAGLYGLQSTKQAQAQGTTDLASALTQIEGNAPSLTESLLSGLRSDRNQRAQLAFEKSQFGVKTKAATAAATTRANTADAALSKTLGFLVNAQGDPVLKGGKIVELPQSTSARKANASLSKSLGYVVDAQGSPILHGGKKIVVPKASTAARITPATRAKALGLARVGHRPGPSGEPPVTWQTYLNTGLSKGIPAEILIEEGRKVYTQAEIHQGLVPGSK